MKNGQPQDRKLPALQRIDIVCDQFESHWKEGRQPDIVAHVSEVGDNDRPALVVELVRLDIEYRRRAGETPVSAEYISRLPEFESQVLLAFDNSVSEQTSEQHDWGTALDKFSTSDLDGEGLTTCLPPDTTEHFDKRHGVAITSGPAAAFPSIAGYRIERRLGAGGMGIVYRAEQLSTKRQVALKTTNAAVFGSEEARIRFEREVELSARLDHPNIARVYASGREGTLYYYALELIEGEALDQFVKQRELDERQLLGLFGKICRAVQHAHQRGVIHRDLKPSNILVDSAGEPHVLDFGLAKAILDEDAEDQHMLTQDGAIAGTPAYMAPEQAAGRVRDIDTRTDVYTLGVILYRLLTNESPHSLEGSQFEVIRRIVDDDVRRPRQVLPKLNTEIDAILLKALAKAPSDRYATAGELADDVDRFLQGDPIEAHTPTALYLLRKNAWKYRLPLMGACAVLALVVAAVGFYIHSVQSERFNTQREFERAERNALDLAAKVKEADENAARADANAETARQNADEAARSAEVALDKQREAERQEAAAIAATALEERQTYWTTIRLVAERLESGRFAGAAKTLWDTKRELRGWEWGYLMSQVPIENWTIAAHEGAVLDMAVSHDGKQLATCGGDGCVAMWTLPGRTMHWEHQANAPLTKVTIDPAGRYVAVADDEGVTILQAADGQLVQRIEGGEIQHLAFVAGGELLLVARDVALNNPRTFTFRTSDWQQVKSVKIHGMTSFAHDSAGKFFAYSGQNQPGLVRLYDPITIEETSNFKATTYWPAATAIAADSKHNVLVVAEYRTLRIFALDDPTMDSAISVEIKEAKGGIYALAIDVEGNRIAAANPNGEIWFVNLKGERRGHVSHGTGVSRVVGLGEEWFVSAGQGGQIKFWDADDLLQFPSEQKIPFGGNGWSHSAAVNGDGYVMGGGGGDFGFWFGFANADTGVSTISQYHPLRLEVAFADFCREDKLFGIGIDRTLCFFDPRKPSRDPERTISCRNILEHAALDEAGETAVVSYAAGGLDVYDTSTGNRRSVPFEHSMACIPLISANGEVAAALVPKSQQIYVWNAVSGQALKEIQGPSGKWHCGALHPDGSVLAAADEHGGIYIFDCHTGEQTAELNSHVRTVNAMQFSPDGKRLFSSGFDRSMRVWDWELGRELLLLGEGDVHYGISIDHTGRVVGNAEGSQFVDLHIALPWHYDELDPAFHEEVLRLSLQERKRRRIRANATVIYGRYPEWTDAHLQSCQQRLARLLPTGGLEQPAALHQQRHLARRLAEVGRIDEALPLLEELVQFTWKHFGDEHAQTFASRVDLVSLLLAMGEGEQAKPIVEAFAGQAPKGLPSVRPFAVCLPRKYDVDADKAATLKEIAKLLYKQVGLMRREYGDEDYWMLTVNHSLGVALLRAGETFSAQAPIRELEGVLKKSISWTHPTTLAPRHNVMLAMQAEGQFDNKNVGPAPLVWDIRRSTEYDHHTVAYAGADAAEAYLHSGEYQKAFDVLRESSAFAMTSEDREPLLSYLRMLLGGSLVGLDRGDEAEALLTAGFDGLAAAEPSATTTLQNRAARTLDVVAELFDAKQDEAKANLCRQRAGALRNGVSQQK